ncbi:MAG: hypothetical protein JOY68_07075 [Candidatus Dormibacteraeota bacterium]|nr:hypothetical protein [Candidatus Dormibacteraeota bacterium]MBV8445052.1 hypothetical protein [Candidatus Dormibacteraeota bacterium]
MLSGCADFTVVAATPTPGPGSFVPPPTGFNHRFGNTPLSSKDGFALERALYGQEVFWEVAVRIEPLKPGYVQLSDGPAVAAARGQVTSILLVIATEDRLTITGLLASKGGDAGQKRYAEQLLDVLHVMGYTNLQSATVLIYFTEADEHARLDWNRSTGYTFSVYDNDLRGSNLTPKPATTPLPAPAAP